MGKPFFVYNGLCLELKIWNPGFEAGIMIQRLTEALEMYMDTVCSPKCSLPTYYYSVVAKGENSFLVFVGCEDIEDEKDCVDFLVSEIQSSFPVVIFSLGVIPSLA